MKTGRPKAAGEGRLPMECREVREYLPAYAEQAGGPRASSVGQHLRTCGDCRAELEDYRTLASQLSALADHPVEPPAWLPGTLVETVGERAETLGALGYRAERLPRPRTIAAGGAILAAGVAGALLFRGMRRRRRASLRRRLQQALAEA